MKFEKFVKQLASTGTIYERPDLEERWLASDSVYMLIPELTRSVTATGIHNMPPEIDKIIDAISNVEDAHLTRAIMPYADGSIKDCLRVYATRNGVSMAISNDDYSLIEKSDLTEILYRYDLDSNEFEPVALLVKQYPKLPTETDVKLVGVIFPAEMPESV